MKDMLAIVLPSGMGVRFVDLTPRQSDQILLTAAQELPPDGTFTQLGMLEAKAGIEAMIKQVTNGPCKSSPPTIAPGSEAFAAATKAIADLATAGKLDEAKASLDSLSRLSVGGPDPNHDANDWRVFDPEQYDDVVEDVRDHIVLKRIYQERNRVSPAEVAAIMGKAVTVAPK